MFDSDIKYLQEMFKKYTVHDANFEVKVKNSAAMIKLNGSYLGLINGIAQLIKAIENHTKKYDFIEIMEDIIIAYHVTDTKDAIKINPETFSDETKKVLEAMIANNNLDELQKILDKYKKES